MTLREALARKRPTARLHPPHEQKIEEMPDSGISSQPPVEGLITSNPPLESEQHPQDRPYAP